MANGETHAKRSEASEKPKHIHHDSMLESPTFYAQSFMVNVAAEEVNMVLCHKFDVTDDGGQEVELFVPRARIFMTLSHFRRFVEVCNNQLRDIDQQMVELMAQAGVDPDVLRAKIDEMQKNQK